MNKQKQLFSRFSCKLGRSKIAKQEVIVTYFYEKKKRLANRYLSFDKVKSYSPNDYAKLAEKQIKYEINNGFLERYSDEYFLEEYRKPKLFVIIAASCGVTSITFASLFTWKALESSNNAINAAIIDPPNGVTLEGNSVIIGQKYEGKITVDTSKTDGKVLSDIVIVKSGDTTLVAPTQYTFTLNDDSTVANLVVFAEYVTGSITIEITLVTPGPGPSPDPRVNKELTFTCEENGSDLTLVHNCTRDPLTRKVDLSYKIDDGDWTDLEIKQVGEELIPIAQDLNKGQEVCVRGNNEYWEYVSVSSFELDVLLFNGEGKFSVSNNIMSLLDRNNFATLNTIPSDNCFRFIFSNALGVNNVIVDASQMVLPATTLKPYCYAEMFSESTLEESTLLEKAPEILPATTLEEGCYESMFNGCTNLVLPPKITDGSATMALASDCFKSMFEGCSSLKVNEDSEGQLLFFDCTNLVGVAGKAVDMFKGISQDGSFKGGTPTDGHKYFAI